MVASGYQYQTLKNFFPDYDDIFYIAENGAVFADSHKPLETIELDAETTAAIKDLIDDMPDSFTITSTAEMACGSAQFYERMRPHYANLTTCQGWPETQEPIVKFAFNCALDMTGTYFQRFSAELPTGAVATFSVNGAIDIIHADINKGIALEGLGKKLGIAPAEMVAVGSGGNDIEILKLVGTGVAMANAPEAVKMFADEQAASNNKFGVLAWLEERMS